MVRHRFTGKREELYQTLKIARAEKLINAGSFRIAVSKIIGAEASYQKSLQKAREKRLAKNTTITNETYDSIEFPTPTSVINRDVYAWITQRSGEVSGLRVRATGFQEDSAGAKTELVDMLGSNVSQKVVPWSVDEEIVGVSTWRELANWWSQTFYYSHAYATSITLYRQTVLVARRKKQSFRDGIDTHCVLDAMEDNINKRIETVKGEKEKNKARRLLQIVDYFKKQYDAGVPEDKMNEVCKELKFGVVVYDIMNNVMFSFNKGAKHTLSYCNVRLNHLEVGRLSLFSKDLVEVSQEQLDSILADCNKNRIFYMFEGDPRNGKPSVIRTMNGCWRVKNVDIEEMVECNNKNGLNDYRFNATLQPELNRFMLEGRIVNSANCMVSGGQAVQLLDMVKAYTQWTRFKDAKFLGKIHQFHLLRGVGVEFMRQNIGIYRFKVLEINVKQLKSLGFIVGGVYTLPSVEALLYADKDWLKIELVSGVWGSAVDISLEDNMLDKRGLYRKWAGRLGMEYDNQKYMFSGSIEEAEHLKAVLGGGNVSHYSYTNLIVIKRPKTAVWTLHHVLAFITAYTRMNILLKMEDVGFENCVSVLMDGIYLKKKFPEDDLFKDKDIVTHTSHHPWYKMSEVSDSFMVQYNTLFEKGVTGRLFLMGGGGSGKSHWVFNNKSYSKDMLYVVPTNVLGKKKQSDIEGLRFTTIHRLIGQDCVSWKDQFNGGRAPDVLFFDEATMVSAVMLAKAFSMYPNSQFIVAGDMEGKQWFQCRNGDGAKFMELYDFSGWAVKKFENDWRARFSPKLIGFKEQLRNEMRKWCGEGGRIDAIFIEEWVRRNVDVVSISDAVSMFSEGDFWIDPVNATSEKLLEAGICSGYRCNDGVGNDGIFRHKGEIVFEDIGKVCVKKGCFTVHSVQGLTCDTGKIFISLRKCFEYAQLYTAISRAVRWEQLVFVDV